jgi:hypothetical protein
MRAEDRLQGMLHRTLKQFHHLQQTQLQIQPSIHCPFLEEQDDDQNHDEKEKPQNEPTADPSPSEISNLKSEIPSVSSVISVVHSSPGQKLQNEPTEVSLAPGSQPPDPPTPPA